MWPGLPVHPTSPAVWLCKLSLPPAIHSGRPQKCFLYVPENWGHLLSLAGQGLARGSPSPSLVYEPGEEKHVFSMKLT